jgi:ribosomal protein RSM22 (predicted rRNA methylase)
MNEKFSYLTVMKAKSPAQIFDNDFMANTPAEKSFFWPRMIRPVIKKHRHSIIDLCNSKGKIERRIIARSHGLEAGYRKVKKMAWGDLWYFESRIPNKFRKEGRYGKRLW